MTTSFASPPPAPVPLERSAPAVRFRWRLFALAVLFIGLLLPRINSGTLWQNDELLTANRAREMLLRHDPRTITLNFAVDLKKPPLHYWLTSVALALLPSTPELAVRLPSLLYGAGCLLALGWLARCCYPGDDAQTSLCAVLALAGCGYFIHVSRLALLDAGAAFHLTLAIVGCQLARKDPRWWWFVALQGVLGAWQKAPFALAAWGVILIVRRFSAVKPARPSWHLIGALAASLCVTSGWWLLQGVRHGFGNVMAALHWQEHGMNIHGDRAYYLFLYLWWLLRDWALVGLCAPVAVFWALRHRSRDDAGGTLIVNPDDPTRELAWVCAVYGFALLLVPFRVDRYLVVITPLLALLTFRWLATQVASRKWLVAVVVASTIPVAGFHYFKPTPPNRELLAVARGFGQTLQPGETLVIYADAQPGFNAFAFVLFYSDLRRPLLELAPVQFHTLSAPARGLCPRSAWPALLKNNPALRQISNHDSWIEFTNA